jgi:hypothetical protein
MDGAGWSIGESRLVCIARDRVVCLLTAAGRVFTSMADLWDFMARALSHIPPDIACDTEDGSSIVQPLQLPEPKRCKFTIDQNISLPVAWKALAAFHNNLYDIANLRDLDDFDEPFVGQEFPSYIS